MAKALRRLADKQAALEESKGTAGRSPLLQSLVQACIVADGCLKRGTGEGEEGDIGSHLSAYDGHMGEPRSPPFSRSTYEQTKHEHKTSSVVKS